MQVTFHPSHGPPHKISRTNFQKHWSCAKQRIISLHMLPLFAVFARWDDSNSQLKCPIGSDYLLLHRYLNMTDSIRKKRKTKGNGDQERQKKLLTMDMKVHNVLSENTGRRKKCCRKKCYKVWPSMNPGLPLSQQSPTCLTWDDKFSKTKLRKNRI